MSTSAKPGCSWALARCSKGACASPAHLRVNAKLLDVHNGYSLWSERYDAEMQDVFAIQEQMADAIVSQLVLKLGVKPEEGILRPATRDVEAYNLYLKGRFFWNRRSPADIRKAVESFQQAIAKDERYAAALSGLGDCYVIAAIQGMESPAALFPLARAAVTSALAVEPEMAEAITTLACIEAVFDWNWTAAEQRFQHAISLNPQYGTAHHWYASNVLIPLGRFAEARQQIEQAAVNDPLAPAIQIMTGLIAWYERDTARAIREYRRALEMDGSFALGHYFLGQALEQAGSVLQAVDSLERALELYRQPGDRSGPCACECSGQPPRRGGSNAAGAAGEIRDAVRFTGPAGPGASGIGSQRRGGR